jgi:hypothetical protein
LILFEGYSPIWIERTTTLPDVKRETSIEKKQESDISLVNALLADGRPRYPRRRRDLQGGELVFVRSERSSGTWTPLRYLLCAMLHDGSWEAVLIDPRLPPERALTPDWKDLTRVKIPGIDPDPGRVLFPAFPLPDGCKDPGWSQT